MPQLGNMKFPYTPAGKQRYQQIKKQIGNKATRPAGMVKPRPIGAAKLPSRLPVGGIAPRKPNKAMLQKLEGIRGRTPSRIKRIERASSRSGMAAQMDRLRSKRPF